MKIRAVILFSFFLLLLHVSPAWAQQPMQGRKTGGRPPCLLPEDLRLTGEQIEGMNSIQRRYLEDITSLRNHLLNRRYQFRRLLSDPTSEAAEIRSKQKEVFALENQIEERILDYQLKMRDILTPQQFRLWVSRHGMPLGRRMHHRRGTGMIHR